MPLTRSDPPGDEALVALLMSGDTDALAEIMRRHGRWVRGVLYSVLGASDDIDDVAQQVWLTFWHRCRDLDNAQRWRHWLYRLARNAAIDAGRKVTRRRRLWGRLTDLFHQGRSPQPMPDREMILEEEHSRVLAALDRLAPIYREAFVLRHMQDLSYREIAEILDVAPETVGTRLIRARRRMLEILQAGEGDA